MLIFPINGICCLEKPVRNAIISSKIIAVKGKRVMKDLRSLVSQCQAELASIGIICGKVSRWSVNTRARTRWGMCKKLPDGTFEIEISVMLLQDAVSDRAAKETVIHELLHTVPGCNGHTGKWKLLAAQVNQKLPMYQIKRTTSAAEKGLQSPLKPQSYRYLLRCTGCGKNIQRQKKSAVVEHPERYRCACGGKLIRIR